jgi:membrane protease YdiL (CAAX protease family)
MSGNSGSDMLPIFTKSFLKGKNSHFLTMSDFVFDSKPSPSAQFLTLMGLWVACFVAGNLSSVAVWSLMTGRSLLTFETDMLNPAYIHATKVISILSATISFLLPAFITARVYAKKPFSELGFHRRLHFNRALTVALIMITAIPLVGFLADLNKAIPVSSALRKMFDTMESKYYDQVKLIASFKSPIDYFVALVVIAFMPAFVEEVFFRGSMQQIFIRWFKNPWLAIFVTAFIFSAIHFSWYGFLARLLLGFVIGVIFYVSGNLWYSVLAHFVNNALTVSVFYWQHLKYHKIDTEFGDKAPWWGGLISAFIVAGLIALLKEFSSTQVATDSIADNSNHSNSIS